MDFRSDTVTRPTESMRAVMAAAPVGDDVYRDDPSVAELERYAADLTGTEAALFACSGTMGNLLALLVHGRRGESVLLGAQSHIYHYEVGGLSALAGLLPYALDDESGLPEVASLAGAVRGRDNVHFAPTSLLCLENTHNRAGGVAVSPKALGAVAEEGHRLGLKVHLDGARLFNACAAFGVEAREYVRFVDSVQLCLSKGLGAPMGSVLCGPRGFVEEARHWRKCIGGGLRQAGVVASAGLMALRDMRSRLAEDHENAALLARLLSEGGLAVEPCGVRTNMVYFRLSGTGVSEGAFQKRCEERGLQLGVAGPERIRMVTHLDVSRQDVEAAARIVLETVACP